MKIADIVINKNRGWRGLAKITAYNEDRGVECQMVFSFSQDVWDDLMRGQIVLQDEDNYYVLEINNTERLPQGHQRSVLIKNFIAKVTSITEYKKTDWMKAREKGQYLAILHFKKNTNNHTTSDWNYIGVRVLPEI